MTRATHKHLFTFGSVTIVAWGLGTFAFIYRYPHFMYNHFKRAITERGVDAHTSSGIPVNTLYALRELASPSGSNSRLLNTGNHDTLYGVGWLDLAKGPLVLHVPAMAGRYYSVQFTDRSDGANFAYVGARTTGTEAGDYLISGPSSKPTRPSNLPQIIAPNNGVLVIARVLVEREDDVSTAYRYASRIQLTPLAVFGNPVSPR